MFYIWFFYLKNELIAHSLFFWWAMWVNRSGCSPKMSNVSESLRLLTKNEQCEWIAQVAHHKWATMSDSLRSLTKNERPWANRSGCSPKESEWANHSLFWANRSLAHLFAKKRVICSENRWANSQPWLNLTLLSYPLYLQSYTSSLLSYPLYTVYSTYWATHLPYWAILYTRTYWATHHPNWAIPYTYWAKWLNLIPRELNFFHAELYSSIIRYTQPFERDIASLQNCTLSLQNYSTVHLSIHIPTELHMLHPMPKLHRITMW